MSHSVLMHIDMDGCVHDMHLSQDGSSVVGCDDCSCVHRSLTSPFALPHAGWLLAVAMQDETIKLWSLHEGNLLRTLHGHMDVVEGVCLSADGRLLASVTTESLCLWNAASGAEVQRCAAPFPTMFLWCVRFAPSGAFLVAGADEGTVWLWHLTSDARARVKVRACGRARAVLSSATPVLSHRGRGRGQGRCDCGCSCSCSSSTSTVRADGGAVVRCTSDIGGRPSRCDARRPEGRARAPQSRPC